MILKLINKKVQVLLMEVPELIKETSIHYVFEAGSEHLHPVLFIGDKQHKENHIVISLPEAFDNVISFVVKLYDDNEKVIHIYQGELAYNKYQITGTKPVRPDFEKYIHTLELEVLTLKETINRLIIEHEKAINDLVLMYKNLIKELEEKGEII
jgi:hypothetical protein